VRHIAAALLLAACCGWASAASWAISNDGRWRVEGADGAVVVRDATGRIAKSIPARSLGGHEDAKVSAARYLPHRRSFVLGFDTLSEVWELSVDPEAAPIHEGLVHDFRMGEAIASPGFLGVRRTRLTAPVQALAVDAGGTAHVLARTADAWWLVNLDIRRPITNFGLALNPELSLQRQGEPSGSPAALVTPIGSAQAPASRPSGVRLRTDDLQPAPCIAG
jgi:hypothetical protein